ncbi:MAG: sialate O-acetylesterase [Opitutaceae bacterium]|jgi:sialate O-acetylesterase
MRLPSTRVLILALALATGANADITLAPLFRDGAVLQREKPVPVWGTADAGESITVTFAGQSASATAGDDGRWSVTFKPLTASSEPRDLAVSGRTKLVVHDVVVGEVWIASGQSNMELTLNHATDAKSEIAAARYPLIRQFKVDHFSSHEPLDTAGGSWVETTPKTAAKFGAVAYFFAVSLHESLHVPIGIINSSWGGTHIESWIDETSFNAIDPARARHPAQAREKAGALAEPSAPKVSLSAGTSFGLFNGMIHPLIPYALRGAIWYQGESNIRNRFVYHKYFTALIGGWRRAFEQGDFPFYWVQLPGFDPGKLNKTDWSWAQLREAQTKVLPLPATGQAITIDIGDAAKLQLHPPIKKPVGQRLALLALARTYKVEHVIDSGPVFKSAKREGAAYRITYEPVAGASTPASGALKAAPAGLTGFELAGSDKVFHPAEAKIDGATVVVSCAEVPEPAAVRYAFRNAPVTGLFNAEGLPAAPFRTDTW